jgi:HD-like signal output (HDOD) protein
MLEAPFNSLDGWIGYFSRAELPVLRQTAKQLGELARNQDSVSGRAIASTVLQDPMMTANVLSFIEAHRSRSRNADITTIDRAIMMMGIGPFFRAFSRLRVLETQLQSYPQALLGVLKVIGRARAAARYARDWAVLRHDLDLDEITVAALLHDLAEILLWSFAPSLALEIVALQQADRKLRSRDAQRRVLGVTLLDLQLTLARAWKLPALLQRLMDDQHAENPRVQNVLFAVNLARHCANGWTDAGLPGDFRDVAGLLRLPVETVMDRLKVPDEVRPAELAHNPGA